MLDTVVTKPSLTEEQEEQLYLERRRTALRLFAVRTRNALEQTLCRQGYPETTAVLETLAICVADVIAPKRDGVTRFESTFEAEVDGFKVTVNIIRN